MIDAQSAQPAAANRSVPENFSRLSDAPLCSGFGGYHSDNPESPFPKSYNSISLPDIVHMVTRPSRVAKEKAQWFIPSKLHTRSAELQRKNGAYFAVWCDFDKPTELEAVKAVLAGLVCFYLVYSSRSATPETYRDEKGKAQGGKKWRVIIPLDVPASATEWQQVTAIINDKFERAGIVPDRVSERENQICFLPNKGEFYQYHIENGYAPLAWRTALADELNEQRRQAEQHQKDIDAQRERSRQKAIERIQTGETSPINAFNACYPLEQCMEAYGYRRIGRKWLSPNSESGSPGVSIKGDKWLSAHSSDSGIGQQCNGGTRGDAFDLFAWYEHGGDRNAAIKAAGAMFRINGKTITQNNQQNHVKRTSAAVEINQANKEEKIVFIREPDTSADAQPFPPDTWDPDTPTKPEWQTALNAHVDHFNETHASVVIGGKHRIMREVSGAATHDGRVTYEFYNRNDLSRVYDNTQIKIGEKPVYKNIRDIYANHLMAWAKNPNSRAYTGGVVFLPGRVPPPDYFNTWRGFSVNPKQNDALLTPIYNHVKDVVCGGNQKLYEYFICWIAYTIQNPDKPAGAALVLRGEKGSGKGTIGHFLKVIWDNHGLHITSPKHLVGNFNAHLNDVCFLFADEAFFSGDHAAEGVLKGLITEPSLMIERKGIDAISQPNYLKIFMATNSDWAVPASKDERRFCVMDVSSAKIGDRDYFNKLWATCHSKEVQAAFLYAMLATDLTGFHTGDIPESAGLREQRFHSMRSTQHWLADSLINGTFNVPGDSGVGDDWNEKLSSDELFRKYIQWCDTAKTGEFRRVSQCELGRYLGKIYEAIRDVGGRGKRGYWFGYLEDAISKFEKYERVNLNELC